MTRPNHKPLLSNFTIGLIAIVLTVIGFYLAFTKSIPFTDGGYELKGGVPGRAEHPRPRARCGSPASTSAR